MIHLIIDNDNKHLFNNHGFIDKLNGIRLCSNDYLRDYLKEIYDSKNNESITIKCIDNIYNQCKLLGWNLECSKEVIVCQHNNETCELKISDITSLIMGSEHNHVM